MKEEITGKCFIIVGDRDAWFFVCAIVVVVVSVADAGTKVKTFNVRQDIMQENSLVGCPNSLSESRRS